MALGKEYEEAALSKIRKQYQEEIRKTLSYLNTVAKYTEKALDKAILSGSTTVSAHNITDEWGRFSFIFFNWDKYNCIANGVLRYGKDELKKILETKYLPLGWKGVRISEPGDHDGEITLY